MCVCACTLWRGVYVWMQTESAFTERFMLIVMNSSCWSDKGEGQTEGETLSEIGKKKKSPKIWLYYAERFLFCSVLFALFLAIIFVTPPTNYFLTFSLLCGVYLYSWSQFTLMLLEYLGSSLKMKRAVFCFFILLVACDIRLWSHFSGSVLLPAGHFRSGLQLPHFHPHSLGSPSICIPPLTTFLPPFTYPLVDHCCLMPLQRPHLPINSLCFDISNSGF